jgi:hypothetical protein
MTRRSTKTLKRTITASKPADMTANDESRQSARYNGTQPADMPRKSTKTLKRTMAARNPAN